MKKQIQINKNQSKTNNNNNNKTSNQKTEQNPNNNYKNTDNNTSYYNSPQKLQQKLINKTQLQEKEKPSPVSNANKPGQVTILSRNQKFTQDSTPSKTKINFYTNLQSGNLTKSSSFSSTNPNVTPVVPASTSEQAPSASVLPIPFGLAPASQSKNLLLNALNQPKISSNPSQDLMSLLKVNKYSSSTPVATTYINDDKFSRLNRINKLRDILRTNLKPEHLESKDFDFVKYFEQVCDQNSIDLKYIQYLASENNSTTQQSDSNLYYGEILIESFRLVNESSKKKSKCRLNAFKNALSILISKSELAVKLAPAQKRGQNFQIDRDQNLNQDFEFEYELYRIDSFENNITNNQSIQSASAILSQNTTKQNMVDLNALLKSMILPKETHNKICNAGSALLNSLKNNNDESSRVEVNGDGEDDDDEKIKTDKETRYIF
jgi:hypothetical protein